MELIKEGFWKSRAEPDLPMPVLGQGPWENYEEFLQRLKRLEKSKDTTTIGYKGFSVCRLCGCANGCNEHRHGNWVWPSGYYHYINMHFVKPSKEFYDFVMGEQ